MDRIDDLVRDAYATVAALVQPMLGSPADVDAFRRADRAVDEIVATDPAYATYRRLRLESAVDGLARIAAGLCGFPDGSDERALVREVLRQWAGATFGDRAQARRAEFVETFDMEYPRRRLRFVIEHLRLMTGGEDHATLPLGADLESASRDLDALCGDIVAAVEAIATPGTSPGSAGRALRAAERAFPSGRVHELARAAADPREAAASHLESSRADVDASVEAIGVRLRDGLPDPPGQGFDTLAHAGAEWSQEVRLDLLVAYTRFALWDALAAGSEPDAPPDAERVIRLETTEHILLLLGEESAGRPARPILAIGDEEQPGRPAGHLRAVAETEPDGG